MQVEIEGDALQQAPVATAEQQSMLGLGQAEVVNGGQQVTLDTPLTDQPLVQGEGTSSLMQVPLDEGIYVSCGRFNRTSENCNTETSKLFIKLYNSSKNFAIHLQECFLK